MFPLDTLDAWPRLYGPRGFVQYQFAVPRGQERVLVAVIELLRRAEVPCFLAVVKDLGAANDAFVSFPLRGWTLALDLPPDGQRANRCAEPLRRAGRRRRRPRLPHQGRTPEFQRAPSDVSRPG
jgi:hypothetical protein